MCQNWDETRHKNFKKQFVESGRSHVMGRLDKHIPGVSERKKPAAFQSADEISDDMIIRPRVQS